MTNGYAFDSVTDRLAKTPNWRSIMLNPLDPESLGIHQRKPGQYSLAYKFSNLPSNAIASQHDLSPYPRVGL